MRLFLRSCIAISAMVIFSVAAAAQITESVGKVAPAADLRPFLSAMSVADIDESVRWYKDNLGFSELSSSDYPDSSLRIRVLTLEDFRIEMIEFRNSVPISKVSEKFPAIDDRSKLIGFTKLGFRTDDLTAIAERLRNSKVTFLYDITEDNERRMRWFIVTDPDGNWLQFFEIMD
jgi:extradiol dioxygenase family protein